MFEELEYAFRIFREYSIYTFEFLFVSFTAGVLSSIALIHKYKAFCHDGICGL
jgi:hypothetical protein